MEVRGEKQTFLLSGDILSVSPSFFYILYLFQRPFLLALEAAHGVQKFQQSSECFAVRSRPTVTLCILIWALPLT